ncbi:protein DBF4 homolog B [Pyxicephalus adspersus]|uniref:protein DBF4 homolog B n=1 Tax=Pyxicephalus adspersus TaxID=30357 RepID=UPI003B59C21E
MAAPSPMPTGQRLPTERNAMLDKRKRITFKGKLFYLDLAHIKQTQHLTKAICSLGGVIEGFLSRDVNYVVTDSRKALDIANGSSVASKRGGHSKRQGAENIEPVLCRGKQLLKKAIQNQQCNNVLANARSWGVGILHVDDVLRYLEISTHSAAKTTEGTGAGKTVKVAKLRSPFLKIEDHSRKYRPLQCCFTNFPEISFIASDRSPFEPAPTNSTQKEKEAGNQENVEGERTRGPQAREKSGYCECCQVTYARLSEHLISGQHSQFALDSSNYKAIDDLSSQLTCDLMELSQWFMPVWKEQGVGDGPVSVEEAWVSDVKVEKKIVVPEVPCEENGAMPPVEEQLGSGACIQPVTNAATGEQEEDMNVENEASVEDKVQRHTLAEDANDLQIQYKEPLQETCDTGAASHVDVVTKVSWYTEEVGLTSVYTVHSLVIPSEGQQSQLTMENALATFAPPLLLSPIADPPGSLGTQHPCEAYNAPGIANPLSSTITSSDHCTELLVEQTSVMEVCEQRQELFAEPSAGNLGGVNFPDAFVSLPAGERRSEEIVEQLSTIQLQEQLLLSDDQSDRLINASTRLLTKVNRTFSKDQQNIIPSFGDPADTLVTTSSTLVKKNSDQENQNQLDVRLFAPRSADTLTAHVATSLDKVTSAPQQNQLNVPLYQGSLEMAEVAQGTTPLGNKAGAPQNQLNIIPQYQGPAVTHDTGPLDNKAHTPELNKLPSATNSSTGKRRPSFSSSPPPPKRQPSPFNPLSQPVWVFHQHDSGPQPAVHGFPDLKNRKKNIVTNEGTADSPHPYFSPKLIQYDASSESDWDSELLSQQQFKHQQGAQLGDLRTAQVNLDESWYGRELCSVLAHD